MDVYNPWLQWTKQSEHKVSMLPDIAMRKMQVANVLCVIDVNHFADGSTLDHLLDLKDWRKVSKDMTDGYKNSKLCANLSYLLTIFFMHSHRFLQ